MLIRSPRQAQPTHTDHIIIINVVHLASTRLGLKLTVGVEQLQAVVNAVVRLLPVTFLRSKSHAVYFFVTKAKLKLRNYNMK